ncbi:MAG: VCBS repeat-containing protein [Candidatus Midichloria sp.]|nr:VCBS repeat-containing protein [Candidatus Midichloria sp.]
MLFLEGREAIYYYRTHTTFYPVKIAISDFDQDGKQDVVVRFIDSLGIGVLLGNGDGTLRTITIYS